MLTARSLSASLFLPEISKNSLFLLWRPVSLDCIRHQAFQETWQYRRRENQPRFTPRFTGFVVFSTIHSFIETCTIRARSVQRYLGRHPPQSPDIGLCSPASYVRGGFAQRAGYQSCDRSGRPSCAASSVYHKRPTLGRCFQPSDAPAGHIGGWICEVLHEVDLGRDIGSQWSE